MSLFRARIPAVRSIIVHTRVPTHQTRPEMARNVATGLNVLREAPFSLDLSNNDQEKLQEVLQDYFTATNDDSDSDLDSNGTQMDNEQPATNNSGKV